MVSEEGVRSLYQGMASPLAAQGVYKAVMFAGSCALRGARGGRAVTLREAGNAAGRAAYCYVTDTAPGTALSTSALFLCGAFAGGMNSFVVTPVELVRNRLIVQRRAASGGGGYRGPIDVVQQTLRAEGMSGMWRGQTSTLARDVPGVGAYFATFEAAKSALLALVRVPAARVPICHFIAAAGPRSKGRACRGRPRSRRVEPARE